MSEMIDMTNPNVLISLAYIDTNDNPLKVFCNYILYLLTSAPNQTLRADELKNNLKNEFGLDMPQKLIQNCVKTLKKSGEVNFLPRGAGYTIGETDFDNENFRKRKAYLQEHEVKLLQSIQNYISEKYEIEWAIEETRINLSNFLDNDDNAARLFLKDIPEYESKNVHPSWYIGRYILEVQEESNKIRYDLERTFLEEIIQGMMIYQGVYQMGDYLQNKSQKFKDTIFYLDTKVILRLLGYSWDEHVIATRELVDLIQKEYGGQIGVFQQTLKEVKKALDNAPEYIESKANISDLEIGVWLELHPEEKRALSILSYSVENELEQKYNVLIFKDKIDWNDRKIQRFGINEEEIINYILNKHTWKKKSVSFDVEVLHYINILREGDYTVPYGGKNKRPIFVTSNADLVYSFKNYVKSKADDQDRIWNPSHLPLISDFMLLFRLWTPFAKKNSDLPAITLSRYAYVAQNPNTVFFEKLRAVANEYKKTSHIDYFNSPEPLRRKVEDILVALSKGDSDNLTEEMVGMSVKEVSRMENIDLYKENAELKEDNQNQNQLLIKTFAKPYINKIGIRRLLIYAARFWWIISTVLLSVISFGVNSFVESNSIIPYVFISALPVMVELLGKFFDQINLQGILIERTVGYAWKMYANKIKEDIISEDSTNKINAESVLNYCLDHTPIFNKYREFCTYK